MESGYGYRRVTKALHRQGVLANHKRVLRIMRQRGLTRKHRHRWIRTTNSNHRYRIYPNLVQNLAVTGPNQVWVSDITYISIQSAFVYLAVILDLFARKAVGYAISRNIDTALSLAALIMAIVNRKPPRGSSTILTRECSMPPMTMWISSWNMDSRSAWPGRGIPTTTPRPRAS
jgi:putative transposase